MRPKVQCLLGGFGSSKLWQFNADTHIVDWLDARGFGVDIYTDEELHYAGYSLLEPYAVVLTGSHPEYTSTEMWDAYNEYEHRGGRLMYLGGDGFYWRIAYHPDCPGIIELRRAETGVRAWAAEPGEYYRVSTAATADCGCGRAARRRGSSASDSHAKASICRPTTVVTRTASSRRWPSSSPASATTN